MYEVIYSIGNDGYRQEHAPAPFDAYLFGGSFVFGEGLNDNETISAFLFNEHGKNIKNFDVVILMTDHDKLNYREILSASKKIIDCRGRFQISQKVYRA